MCRDVLVSGEVSMATKAVEDLQQGHVDLEKELLPKVKNRIQTPG